MNFSYYSKKDKNGKSLLEDSGLQSEFGLSFLFGAGIEIDLYKGLMLKSEYRHETFTQLILIGIGYNFSK
jgi:opacity protein-like surface antigen